MAAVEAILTNAERVSDMTFRYRRSQVVCGTLARHPLDWLWEVDVAEGAKRKRSGPRTAAGRRAVRLNPVKHGVLSQTPVIPLVERVEDWERLLEGTLEYFQVEGMVEEDL